MVAEKRFSRKEIAGTIENVGVEGKEKYRRVICRIFNTDKDRD